MAEVELSKKSQRLNMHASDTIVQQNDVILVTGATGFIGSKVVESLLNHGFHNLTCFARPSSNLSRLHEIARGHADTANIEVIQGNLLSREDCFRASEHAALIYHLAAGRGEKFFSDAVLNSVVTTRNLLDACLQHNRLKRFVNISSLTVYTNRDKSNRRVLDESCPVEQQPERRGEAYCFAKAKQDELVIEYGQKFGIRYVIVRPGVVYGPGNEGITGRVGLGTFGMFLHLGGSNVVPLTYIDNCAEAIVLAGIRGGVDGEVFNVVDDHLPSSRQFLRLYKKNVRPFQSIYVPRTLSFLLCYGWEKYSEWSHNQLPADFNRRRWHAIWKGSKYSNEKLKDRLGWTQKVPTTEALNRYFKSCRGNAQHA